jgi:hypothetical protein
VLAVYEPLAVVAGIVGLFIVIERADRFVGLLVTWVVVATLLATTPAGRANGDVLLIVLPLALLAGYALQALADSLRALRFSIEEGVSIVVILPVIAYFFLSLAGYANNPGTGLLASSMINLGPAAPFIPMFFALALMVIVIMLFAALSSAETAMRGGAMAALAVLVMVTWSTGWGAVQVRPGDPRELIAGPEATSPAVRELARDLAVLSADTTADPTTLPLVVQSPPDGVLGWYLRNMSDVHFVTTLDVSSAPQVLITTDAMSPALSGSYAGERFTLRHEWRIEGKSSNDVFKWLIYRRAELPSPTRQATLWVQQGQ